MPTKRILSKSLFILFSPATQADHRDFIPKRWDGFQLSKGVDLYLHVQGLDTGTPAVRAMFPDAGRV